MEKKGHENLSNKEKAILFHKKEWKNNANIIIDQSTIYEVDPECIKKKERKK